MITRTLASLAAGLALASTGTAWATSDAHATPVTDWLCTGSAAQVCTPTPIRPAPAVPDTAPPYPFPSQVTA